MKKHIAAAVLAMAMVFVLLPLAAPKAEAYGMGKIGELQTVSAGFNHSLAIKKDGTLWAWGRNDFGQLGDGATTNRSAAVKIMDDAAAVAAGSFFSLALKTDGTLWGWGDNSYGELGNDGLANLKYTIASSVYMIQTVPIKIMDDVASVSAGFYHTLALKTDGTLWACGDNRLGQLGNGGGGDAKGSGGAPIQMSPVKIMDDVAAAYAGGYHSLAVKRDGTLWAWGLNVNGQIGNNKQTNAVSVDGYAIQTVPVKIMDDAAFASAGGWHNFAVKTDGTLWGWGFNNFSQLGNGGAGNDKSNNGQAIQTVPIKIMDGVAAVAAGRLYTLAVKTDGSLWGWGENNRSPLGNGGGGNAKYDYGGDGFLVTYYQTIPIKIMDDVVCAIAGDDHSFAVKGDGTLWGWGYNELGQLGDGTTVNKSTPAAITDNVMLPGESKLSAVKEEEYSVEGADTWAVAELEEAFDLGIVPSAIAEGGWRNTTTRLGAAEAIVRVIEAAKGRTMREISADNGWDLTTPYFTDTDSVYVTFLGCAGITNGVGGGLYGPEGSYNRAQMVTMIGRAAEKFFGVNASRTNPFTDNVPDWAAAYVGYAAAEGITQGISATEFNPYGDLQNQHTIVFCLRTFKALESR